MSKDKSDVTSSPRKRGNSSSNIVKEKFEPNTPAEALKVNTKSNENVLAGPQVKRKKQSSHIECPSYPGFSLRKLEDELKKTDMPPGWGFFLPNENFLLIGFWSASGGPTKKEFHIYPDGGVQVC